MQNITPALLEDELQNSYLDYAMSVIIGRAIPDARDGLKPAQRRILYSMYDLNNTHDQPTKKSARVVGNTIGKFHPHGDIAVYDALVRMAQDFSMNHTLVEGQGNFGSRDGDPPAAMRYTEVRLTKMAEEMLADLDKETVDFVPNFDNTEKEPVILPSKIPNLLVNGSSGIAVGVATSIPPHNLSEVCSAIVHVLDNKDATVDDILQIIKGPDFPTGGTAIMSGAALNGYRLGRGQLTIRAKADLSNGKKIIFTELPYNVNKSAMIRKIADSVREKKIIGIRDIRDESGKAGIKVVIDLKEDAEQQQILNLIYKHTQAELTFPIINLAVIGKSLRSFNILQMLNTFITYRREIVTKRSTYQLNIAKDRLHIVHGLLIAITKIDDIIKNIRESKEVGEARNKLMANFSLSEKQANSILDMKLSKLTRLENDTLSKEKSDLEKEIAYYTGVLADQSKIDQIIKDETNEIKKKYGRERKTELVFSDEEAEIQDEDLISDEPVTILLTNSGYVKRMSTGSYKEQDRGGKGIIAINLKEGDFVKQVVTARNKDFIICVSNQGRIYWLKAYNVPEGSRYSDGRAIANLLRLENENIVGMFNIKQFEKTKIGFLTAKGLVKKLDAVLFSHPRAGGVRAITLNEGDSIADTIVYTTEPYLAAVSKNGKSVQFSEANVRFTGRTSAGVRGIRLKSGDEAKNIIASADTGSILTVSEKGYGKITDIKEYRVQGRGGSGVINLKVNEKTGPVAKALFIKNEQKLLLLNSKGISIEIPIASIRITGRAASGVRLMKVEPGAKIIDARLLA